jgi:hypothetical protein
MNESECRYELRRALTARGIPTNQFQPLWRMLGDYKWSEELCNSSDGIEGLVRQYRQILDALEVPAGQVQWVGPRARRRGPAPRSTEDSAIWLELDQDDRDWSETLAEIIIEEARTNDSADAFRARWLPERPMTWEEADNAISSPLLASAGWSEYEANEWTLDTRATLLSEETSWTPAGRRDVRVLDLGLDLGVTLTQEVAGGPSPATEVLTWRRANGRELRIPYWPDSMIEVIRWVAHDLMAALPLDEAGAARLLLCDAPGIEPISARIGRYGCLPGMTRGRIELSIDPRVSAKTVARMYKELRRLLIGQDSPAAAESRSFGERGLALLLFGRSRRAQGMTYQQIADEWNRRHARSHPDWMFPDGSMRRVGRDMKLVEDRLLRRDIRVPLDKPDADGNLRQSAFVRVMFEDRLTRRSRRGTRGDAPST